MSAASFSDAAPRQDLPQDFPVDALRTCRRLFGAVVLATLVTACGGGGGSDPAPAPAPTVAAEFVSGWNAISVEAFARYDARARADVTDVIAPLVDSDEERLCTMTFIAMHDALNAVDRRFAPAVADLRDANADPGAALATAAHDVLVAVPVSYTHLTLPTKRIV